MTLRDGFKLKMSSSSEEFVGAVKETLGHYGISMYNADGDYKDTHTLLCEIYEALNKEK